MVEQYTERHYDDDLTIGADDYDDSFQTPDIDLFEYAGANDSPISRLKSLVLSIDWEITDEVLLQFNEELLDLKDVWAGDQIRQVYLQALEKISKYIYREKADANPNSIKLLLSLYYNLEKIVSSDEITEEEKKQLLLEDVRNFEKLKHQIQKMARGKKGKGAGPKTDIPAKPDVADSLAPSPPPVLTTLKAVILGIDWEITDKELLALRQEVSRLHEVFMASRPKLIFLQGIGTLGAYIRNKKSNAHADAFKLLHSFFAGLEKIVNTSLSLAEEKEILLPEVAKFNAFKQTVLATLSPESLQVTNEVQDDRSWVEETDIQPAFANIPGETKGFQEDEVTAGLGLSATIETNIEKFFGEGGDLPVRPGGMPSSQSLQPSQPTNVDDIPSPVGAADILPASRDEGEDEEEDEKAIFDVPGGRDGGGGRSIYSETALRESPSVAAVADELMVRLDNFFTQETAATELPASSLASGPKTGPFAISAELALQGVNVEAEGDDLEGADEVAAVVAEKSTDWDQSPPSLIPADTSETLWPGGELPQPGVDDSGDSAKEASFTLADEVDVELDRSMPILSAADLSFSEEPLVDQSADIEPEWTYPAETADTCEEVQVASGHEVMLTIEEDEPLFEPLTTPALSAQSEFGDTTAPVAEETVWADEMASDPTDAFDQVWAELESAPSAAEQVTGLLLEDSATLTVLPSDADADSILLEAVDDEDQLIDLADGSVVLSVDHAEQAEPDVYHLLNSSIVSDDTDEISFTSDSLADGWADDGGVMAGGNDEEPLVVEQPAAIEEVTVDHEYAVVFTGVDDDDQAIVESVGDGLADVLREAGPTDNLLGLAIAAHPPVEDVAKLLDGMESAIGLLGAGKENNAIASLFQYINSLRHKWVGQPLAKIYLQLLSTLTQYIDQHQDETEAGTYELLVTVFNSLKKYHQDQVTGQERLLLATFKVLQWQRDVLTRPVAPVGEAVAESGTTGIESPAVDHPGMTGLSSPDDAGDDLSHSVASRTVKMDAVAGSDQLPAAEELSSAVLRRELDFLRHALQEELAELRSALKTSPK